MKKELVFSCLLLMAGYACATDLPASSATAEQKVCKCGEGCDCLKTPDACSCDKTKSGDNDDKDGGCGGFCGRAVQVCEAGCKGGSCTKGADQTAA